MGSRSSSSRPRSASQTTLPSFRAAIEVDIIHPGTELGQVEAEKAMETLKSIFPNSTVNLHPQGKVNNLVILYDNKAVFDRKKGDGHLGPKNLHPFISKLTKLVLETQTRNEVFEIHRTEGECDSL